MADSPNKTPRRKQRIIKMGDYYLGNVPDDELVLPTEQNTLLQIIAYSPHGLCTDDEHEAKNYMYYLVEQVYGIKVPDMEGNLQLNLLQYAESLAESIRSYDVSIKNHSIIPRRLLWYIIMKEEREVGRPVYGWFYQAVDLFLSKSTESRAGVIRECAKYYKNFPHTMYKQDNEML